MLASRACRCLISLERQSSTTSLRGKAQINSIYLTYFLSVYFLSFLLVSAHLPPPTVSSQCSRSNKLTCLGFSYITFVVLRCYFEVPALYTEAAPLHVRGKDWIIYPIYLFDSFSGSRKAKCLLGFTTYILWAVDREVQSWNENQSIHISRYCSNLNVRLSLANIYTMGSWLLLKPAVAFLSQWSLQEQL